MIKNETGIVALGAIALGALVYAVITWSTFTALNKAVEPTVKKPVTVEVFAEKSEKESCVQTPDLGQVCGRIL